MKKAWPTSDIKIQNKAIAIKAVCVAKGIQKSRVKQLKEKIQI